MADKIDLQDLNNRLEQLEALLWASARYLDECTEIKTALSLVHLGCEVVGDIRIRVGGGKEHG